MFWPQFIWVSGVGWGMDITNLCSTVYSTSEYIETNFIIAWQMNEVLNQLSQVISELTDLYSHKGTPKFRKYILPTFKEKCIKWGSENW